MLWDTVIGLEVHAQLSTSSKLFSGAATTFGAPPNSQASYIDAGLPGVLPVLNQKAVYMAVQFGLAIQGEINQTSWFERKHYFYPDLPKGYQTSQFQRPIVSNGHLYIDMPTGLQKKISIVRAHLEEDAGKSLHEVHSEYTGIDLNRAGNPLLEIVTAPCFHNAEEVIIYLKTLHQLLRFLGICDGNMQEGSFRCDVNISLKPAGSIDLGTRSELKNLNSFRFIEKAIIFEQARQQDLLKRGQAVIQETRLFSPTNHCTQALRNKENSNDYRYFPDPDLLPVFIEESVLVEIKENLPALPGFIKQKLRLESDINEEDIAFLLSEPSNWQFFCEVSKGCVCNKKTIINWLKGPYTEALNEANLDFKNPIIPAHTLAELLNHLHQQAISNTAARHIFSKLCSHEKNLNELMAEATASPAYSQEAISILIQTLISKYPTQANEYRQGREKLLAFFTGQIMKETKGLIDPAKITTILKKELLS